MRWKTLQLAGCGMINMAHQGQSGHHEECLILIADDINPAMTIVFDVSWPAAAEEFMSPRCCVIQSPYHAPAASASPVPGPQFKIRDSAGLVLPGAAQCLAIVGGPGLSRGAHVWLFVGGAPMRPSRRQLGSPLETAPAQQGWRRDYRPERFQLEGAWAAAKVKNGAMRENHARGSLAYRASPDCDEGIACWM
jgi:hypothetical protein